MSASTLTAELARFVSAPIAALDEDVAKIVTRAFTDTIATMIAGRNEPNVEILLRHVEARRSARDESSILLGARRASSTDAALINGTAAHVLDYDDVALGGHPSTVLVPAILAEGEALDASGAAALEAYLVGYEVWGELISREPDPYHEKGWHPTAVLGPVAVAAAISRLHGLDAETSAHALGISASFASGIIANFGTMTKSLHAGRAAAGGIEAVHLAKAGLTSSPDAFEHGLGYLAALSPKSRADRMSPASGLGSKLRIRETGLSIKKYPVCYAAHRTIDGVLDLVKANRFEADEVDEVEVTLGTAQALMLRNHAPRTGLEAKFSLQFAVASSLVAKRVGLSELQDDFVNMPTVREAMTKVRMKTTETRCPIEPVFALSDRVEIRLKDGRAFDSGEIRFARGGAQLPLRDEELKAKFFDCAAGHNRIDASQMYDSLEALSALGSLRTLRREATQP